MSKRASPFVCLVGWGRIAGAAMEHDSRAFSGSALGASLGGPDRSRVRHAVHISHVTHEVRRFGRRELRTNSSRAPTRWRRVRSSAATRPRRWSACRGSIQSCGCNTGSMLVQEPSVPAIQSCSCNTGSKSSEGRLNSRYCLHADAPASGLACFMAAVASSSMRERQAGSNVKK